MPLTWDTPGLVWDSGLAWDFEPTTTTIQPTSRPMANNALPDTLDDLISLAEDCADGAQQHEVAIGLLQNKEAGIRADLTALLTARNGHNTLNGQSGAKEAAVAVARSNARATLTVARDLFKTTFGNKAGQAWTAAGWPADSTAVPSTSDKLLPLLMGVKAYLTANVAREVAAVGVTAANMQTLHTALSDAVAARNQHKTALGVAIEARDVKENSLRARLRGLIGELGQLLAPLDPKWLAFGLNRPGAEDAPDAPESTTVTPLGGGKVRVQCPRVPRADYYQVYLQVVGTDPDFRFEVSNPSHDIIIENLPAGATVKFKMRAVNEANPGPFGDEVSVVVS